MPLLTLGTAISALYLYKLNGVGVLGPDEPRYAAVGNAMAQTRDFVTPKLWGSPWFEKPPLLYWMTACGTLAGLKEELASRLPVALLSLTFLCVSFFLLREEFGPEPAAISAALLATSAGWMTYSELGLTDLPLAVFFSLAVFLALPLLRAQPEMRHIRRRFVSLGGCLGLAALAKGLVPLALAVPFFWFLRRFWRNWWLAVASCALVAVPWYWAAYSRNGYPFLQELFIRHHFERLYSPALQHVQPWYYFFPVLLAGVFPWIPLLGIFVFRKTAFEQRRRFLATVFVFGFAIFTASLNKLPGYLLPLFPSLFALIGAEFQCRRLSELSRWWLVACALLIATIPIFASALPPSLSGGRFSHWPFTQITRTQLLYVALPLLVVFVARRSWIGLLLVLCVVAGGIYLKAVDYPILDHQVSPRGMWRQIKGISNSVCDGGTNRDWILGLNFYRGTPFPVCGNDNFSFALRSHYRPGAVLEPLKPSHP